MDVGGADLVFGKPGVRPLSSSEHLLADTMIIMIDD